ncbi:hypothetical protein D3C72_2017490 [compost metagenome]
MHSIDEAVAAVRHTAALSRTAVRAAFEARFTVERMARDYVCIYRSLADPGVTATPQPEGEPGALALA